MTFLARSKNSIDVFYDSVSSHAATHLEDTPQLAELVVEVITNMDLEDDDITTDVDMGRIVGTCDVVKVEENDDIVYGVRKNRDDDGHVPFTKSRAADPCSQVAVHLIKQSNGTYLLSSAWIGTLGGDDEPFPNAPDATPRSKEFWSKHAFVYGSQEMQAGTETDACPWR